MDANVGKLVPDKFVSNRHHWVCSHTRMGPRTSRAGRWRKTGSKQAHEMVSEKEDNSLSNSKSISNLGTF